MKDYHTCEAGELYTGTSSGGDQGVSLETENRPPIVKGKLGLASNLTEICNSVEIAPGKEITIIN